MTQPESFEVSNAAEGETSGAELARKIESRLKAIQNVHDERQALDREETDIRTDLGGLFAKARYRGVPIVVRFSAPVLASERRGSLGWYYDQELITNFVATGVVIRESRFEFINTNNGTKVEVELKEGEKLFSVGTNPPTESAET